jgi:hypothetical protein
MLNGNELDDLAKAHDLGFAKWFFGQECLEFIQRFRTSDQHAAGRRNAWTRQQKAPFLVALLQEAPMRRDQLRIALLERDKMFSLKEKMLHRDPPPQAIQQFAAADKMEMRRRLVTLVEAIGISAASRVADAVFLLIDGAYASSQTLGGRDGPARAASWAADALIDASLVRAD